MLKLFPFQSANNFAIYMSDVKKAFIIPVPVIKRKIKQLLVFSSKK